jgi:hypothetical protein
MGSTTECDDRRVLEKKQRVFDSTRQARGEEPLLELARRSIGHATKPVGDEAFHLEMMRGRRGYDRK